MPPNDHPAPTPDYDAMAVFLSVINANPSRSTRFIPKGARREGYPLNENKKQPVLRYREREHKRMFFPGEDGKRDLMGSPATSAELEVDPFLARGDLLGVKLLHEDGRCGALFVDLDAAQIRDGGLPVVVRALDLVGVRYLLERSSSGTGIHVWLPFGKPVEGACAKAWVEDVLLQGGATRKTKDKHGRTTDPGHYDEVKPTANDGGITIVPHFFADGRASLVRVVGEEVVTIRRDEGLAALQDFIQLPTVVTAVEAYQPAVRPGRPRSARARRAAGESEPPRRLTQEQVREELGLLKWVVSVNPKLRDFASVASREWRDGQSRSEASFGFLASALVDHDFAEEVVHEYVKEWPKYGQTSLKKEVSRVLFKASAPGFLERTSTWRTIIRPSPQVSRTSVTQDQLRGDVDNLVGLVRQLLALPGDQPRRLLVLDAPTGADKSTIFLPKLALALITDDRRSVTIYRERRDDCLRVEKFLNNDVKTLEVEQFLRLFRQHLDQPITAADYLRSPSQSFVTELDLLAGGHAPFGRVYYGEGEPPFAAAAAVSWRDRAECRLANEAPEDFQNLKETAEELCRSPCVAGCQRVDCRQNPAFLKHLQPKPHITIRTHKAVEPEASTVALWDERPQEVTGVASARVSRDGDWGITVEPLDTLAKLLSPVGEDLDSLEDIRTKLVDAFETLEKNHEDERYRVFDVPRLDIDTEAVFTKLRAPENLHNTVAAARGLLDLDNNLVLKLKELLSNIEQLFNGDPALWTWTSVNSQGDMKLELLRGLVRWKEVLGRASPLTVVFDGTACAHWEYAALPQEGLQPSFIKYHRPRYPNLVFRFDQKSLPKGRGMERFGAHRDYVLQSVHELLHLRHPGDILVVTHKEAEDDLAAALQQDEKVAQNFVVVLPGRRLPAESKSRLFIGHFGAIKGTNEYREAAAVIISHKHNLNFWDAAARALATFGTLSLEAPDGDRALGLIPMPRQWTPPRRSKSGEHKDVKGLMSWHADICYSPEVAYVMRSHLASEVVQAIMRCKLRQDPTASVRVFLPLGDDTALGVRILRELPGASMATEP